MQMLVTCAAQEPMVTLESKEGEQKKGALKKKAFTFKNDQNEFYAEAIGGMAERLEKTPLEANTLYQVDVTISLSSWTSERTHEQVFKNQIRLNKVSKVSFESC